MLTYNHSRACFFGSHYSLIQINWNWSNQRKKPTILFLTCCCFYYQFSSNNSRTMANQTWFLLKVFLLDVSLVFFWPNFHKKWPLWGVRCRRGNDVRVHFAAASLDRSPTNFTVSVVVQERSSKLRTHIIQNNT